MKMFMPLRVRESGVINWKVSEGETLTPGVTIAKLHLDNPDCVKKVDIYKGGLSEHEYKPVQEHRRSEEHTSELQSLMRISYAVFCLTNKIIVDLFFIT